MKKTKRRLFCFFVAFAMVLSIVQAPSTVSQAADIEITEINLYVTSPLIGGDAEVEYTADYGSYTVIAKTKNWNWDNQFEVDTIETFDDYGVIFVVEPEDGYTLAQDATVTVNGSDEGVTLVDGTSEIQFICTPETKGTITSIELTDLPQGNIGDKTEAYSATGEHYSVSGSWYMYDADAEDDEKYKPIDNTHTFAEGNTYKFEYTIDVTDEGYIIDDNAVLTVDGEEVWPDEWSNFCMIGSEYVSYATEITEVVIPEDKIPVATIGESFTDTPIKITETDAYTVYGQWYDASDPFGTFTDKKAYEFNLKIYPKAGYAFPFGGDGCVDIKIGDGEIYTDWPDEPTLAYAYTRQSFKQIIDKVILEDLPEAAVGEPIDGGTDGWFEVSVPADANYEAKAIWYDSTSEIAATGKFEQGKSYILEIDIEAKATYEFADTVTVNAYGVDEKVDSTDYESMWYYRGFSFYDVIDKIEVTGVTEPVVGQAPVTDTIKVPADANYHIESVEWLDNATMETTTVFEDGHAYSLSIYVRPNTGYEFSELATIILDGEDVFDQSYVGTDGAYLMESYSFEKIIPEIKINNVPEMKIGDTAKAEVTVPTGANYTANAFWSVYDEEAGMYKEFTGVFETGKVYSLSVAVIAKSGYRFDEEKTVIYINDVVNKDEKAKGHDYYYIRDYYEGLKVIDKIEFTVSEPVVGGHASIEPSITLPDGVNYSLDSDYSVDWLMGDSNRYVYVYDYFEEGVSYGVDFAFVAHEGYVFAEDLIVVVNGKALNEDDYSILVKTGSLTYFFNSSCAHKYSSDSDGTCDVCGYVRFDSSPGTGDSLNLELMLMLMAICGAGVVSMYRMKKKES